MNLKLHALMLAALYLMAGPASAEAVRAPHIEAELIAENMALVPGTGNWVALRLKPDAGWHTYWRNPGDSGLPTRLIWTLPRGVGAGEIVWPYPQLLRVGELANYGYDRETLHWVPLRVAASVGQNVTLVAEAKWLVCADLCIPGSARLSLELPVATQAHPDPRWQALFAKARTELPQPASTSWHASYQAADGDLSLQIQAQGIAADARIGFFPYANNLVTHAAPQRVALEADGLRLSQSLSSHFVEPPASVQGVLVMNTSGTPTVYEIAAVPGTVTPVAEGASDAVATASLPLILGFALLGGLILNLMPCVFPVLSIKAVSVLEARGSDHHTQRRHALAYTAGVVVSCVVVAAALLVFRAGGERLGWGFQLQSPPFVALLAYLLFALGLSLSGVVQFGTRFMGVGQSLTEQGGYGGSFFTGALATVVASPCTAPFMGTALGYAFTQPAPVALAVFMMLGLGLASPFLLIGFFPRLGGFLPKPGAWMETFKQVMAFPLYLTVIWLVWVLNRQTGADATALVLIGLLLIAFVSWVWNHATVLATVCKYAALAGALILLALPQLEVPSAKPAATVSQESEPYSDQRLAELRGQGRIVFVNLTADWCITCKFNERLTLENAVVKDAFAKRHVAWLVGDWTRNDPATTRVLQRFGRPGVPLYLLYPPQGEPVVLPQILTPGELLQALERVP